MKNPTFRFVADSISHLVLALRAKLAPGNMMLTAVEVAPCATPRGDARFLLEAQIVQLPNIGYDVYLAMHNSPKNAEDAAKFNLRGCHTLATLATGCVFEGEVKTTTGESVTHVAQAEDQEFSYWALVGGMRT